jgi:hypothetical protein
MLLAHDFGITASQHRQQLGLAGLDAAGRDAAGGIADEAAAAGRPSSLGFS